MISSSNVVNAALHVEAIFGDGVVLAVENLLEAANGFHDRHLPTVASGERLRDAERLAEEALDLARAEDGDFVLGRELVEAEYRDDVLQILESLQHLLHTARPGIMLVADDFRRERTR